MIQFRIFLARLQRLVSRRSLDRELKAEIASHLEEATQEYIREGLSEAEARRSALLKFGSARVIEEDMNAAVRGWAYMCLDSVWHDARHAVRRLRRRPSGLLAVVGILGLAIGITAAMFTLIDALLIRPVPFKASDQLARVRMGGEHGGIETIPASVLGAWRRSKAFAGVEAARSGTAVIVTDQGTVKRGIAQVTPGMFDLLGGVRPVGGRLFDATEGWLHGTDDRVLVSEDVWRGSYHSDPALIGRTISIDGRRSVVIGILPSEFRFPTWNTVIWRPANFESAQPTASDDDPFVYVRFTPRVPEADALRIATIAAKEAAPKYAAQWAQAVPLAALDVDAKRAVPFLIGGVVILFLVLCANATHTLLHDNADQETGGDPVAV